MRTGDIVIHYWPGQERLARSLLPGDAALRFPGLADDVLQRGEEVTVFLAPDAARWDSLTGGRAPDWGAGIALPLQGIVMIPGYVSDRGGTHTLPVILRHELAHIALQRHLDAPIPRWFNEGYATWAAGQLDADAGWMLRLAFLTNRAPPLDSLTLDWPLLAADARLAYLLSASAVQYLYSLGTQDTFERFLATWSETGSFERGLRGVYILASPQFERLWRAHVRRNYGWLQFVAQSMFIWLVITVLVLALFVIRRRRDRQRLARLRANEPPDLPAYWLDPPVDPPASGAGPVPGEWPAAPADGESAPGEEGSASDGARPASDGSATNGDDDEGRWPRT
ncbi:hypothetical protein BH23GEM9_BH23GEM9_28250 [soil metagenome]